MGELNVWPSGLPPFEFRNVEEGNKGVVGAGEGRQERTELRMN